MSDVGTILTRELDHCIHQEAVDKIQKITARCGSAGSFMFSSHSTRAVPSPWLANLSLKK
jgi:hypothetical protein